MSERRRVLIVLVCLGLLTGALLALLSRDPGPRYKGKSLRKWLACCTSQAPPYFLAEDIPIAPPEVAEALKHFGTNALPLMLEWIREGAKPSAATKAAECLDRLPDLLVPDFLPDWLRRSGGAKRGGDAMVAFSVLGEESAPAIPALISLVRTGSYFSSSAALTALSGVGTNALPFFVGYIGDESAPKMAYAIGLFVNRDHLRTNAAAVLPTLFGYLNGPNQQRQRLAVWAIARLQADPSRTLPQLIHSIEQSQDDMVVCIAMSAVGEFGPEGRPAIPAISRWLRDPSYNTRQAATNALLKIAPEALTNSPIR